MAALISDITDQTSDALRHASAYIDDLTTPILRLGVTGLSRAGKTVFITALIQALTTDNAVPAIGSLKLPGYRAFLEPQPDDDVPRFGYEGHLSALTSTPARWPESTRHISQLRVTLEWDASDWLRRKTGIQRRLHLDIIDYPGEWLADIGLLEQDYDAWSAHVSALARAAPAGRARDDWMSFQEALTAETSGIDAEQAALRGARLFTEYLSEQKQSGRLAPSAGPGRFLMPGDYEGSPMLTFFPWPGEGAGNVDQKALLARRYESYKANAVRPFFEKHFSRIDRQIVLVDVLGALNQGPAAVIEMENALERALTAFRPGPDNWLGRLFTHRIDSIMFAATKADHLNQRNHPRLQEILAKVVDRARSRAIDAGARIATIAIAALRTTEDVERSSTSNEPPLPCVRGMPIEGQTLAGKPLDTTRPLTVFPGDLPKDPIDAFDADIIHPGSLNFVRFRPRLQPGRQDNELEWPHAGLDRVLAFLLGDRLQ